MEWTCKKTAYKLTGLFGILPVCYLYEHAGDFELIKLSGIILIIVCLMTLSCNNIRLAINENELTLKRIIGKELHLEMNRIRKIVLVVRAGKRELWVHSWNELYHFSVNSFESSEIKGYLEQLKEQNGIAYIREEADEEKIMGF